MRSNKYFDSSSPSKKPFTFTTNLKTFFNSTHKNHQTTTFEKHAPRRNINEELMNKIVNELFEKDSSNIAQEVQMDEEEREEIIHQFL